MSGPGSDTSASESDDGRELTRPEIDRIAQTLNAEYYSANPHMYFHQRLAQLFIVAAAPEKLDALAEEGLRLGEITLSLSDPQVPVMSPLVDDETRQKYVAMESTVLLHHAAEVLLRLELAHERQPRCPWLEMVNLRRDFKEKLRKRFPEEGSQPDDSTLLFPVYYLASSRDQMQFADDSLQPDLDNISAFMHHFASIHIKEAAVYNSAKHGLGVVAGETQFSMEGGLDWKSMSIAGLDRSGPAVSHLLMRSVNVERDLQFTVVATKLIRQLWDVAKARYVGAEWPRLDMFSQPKFKDVSLCRQTWAIDRMRVPLWLFGADSADSPSTPPAGES